MFTVRKITAWRYAPRELHIGKIVLIKNMQFILCITEICIVKLTTYERNKNIFNIKKQILL